MPSETFYCPHCRRQLTKSVQAYVMGEIIESKANFMGLGQMANTVSCPGCRRSIDTMKMINGEYDKTPVDTWNAIVGLIVIAAILILKLLIHWSWLASVVVGLIGGVIITNVFAEMFRPKRKK